MANEVATVDTQTGEIVQADQQQGGFPVVNFSPKQIDILRNQICPGADNDELALFIEQSKQYGLNPFKRQIYLVKRWDSQAGREVGTIQVGIDGYRLIADRTGKYAGQDEPEYTYRSDDMTLPVWENLLSSTVTVYKFVHGERVAFTHTAYWDEYVQTKRDGNPTKMWLKMPRVMLAKCAEAGAFRKGFPGELGGLYTHEEMMQAENELPPARSGGAGSSGSPGASSSRSGGGSTAKFDPNVETFNFGKFKGKKWIEADNGYLTWLTNNSNRDDIKERARFTLAARDGGGQQSESDAGDEQPEGPRPSLDPVLDARDTPMDTIAKYPEENVQEIADAMLDEYFSANDRESYLEDRLEKGKLTDVLIGRCKKGELVAMMRDLRERFADGT